MLGEVALNEITCLFSTEAQKHPETVHVTCIETDGVSDLSSSVLILQEVVWHLWRPSHLGGAFQTDNEEIENQAVVLHDERGKLKTTDYAVAVDMVHVLVVNHNVVLRCHIVSDVMIDDKAQQTVEQSEIYLLVDLLETRLKQHVALAFAGLPHILKGQFMSVNEQKLL